MIKKLVPFVALSASTQASIIPYDLEIKQYQDSNLVKILLQEEVDSLNITQLYLNHQDISFRNLLIDNPQNERFRLFTNSMRMYDTNSDDVIFFNFKYQGHLDSFDIGVGYYEQGSYIYDKRDFQVEQIPSSKVISVKTPPFGIGVLGIGLYCLYRQKKDDSMKLFRKMK